MASLVAAAQITITVVENGANGVNGVDGQSYWLIVDADVIAKKNDESLSPAVITMTGKTKVGTKEPTDYAGRYAVQESLDGTNFEYTYRGTADAASRTYEVSSNKVKAVKISFYLAGGRTTLLDEKIIPVLADGETGRSYYTWIQYANSETGENMSDSAEGKDYIGIAVNKTTPEESTNPADYTWSKIRADSGIFTEEPLNRHVGMLWIKKADDPSKPDVLLRWDGSAWVQQTMSLAELDPTQYKRLTNVVETMNGMADDGQLTVTERSVTNDKVISIVGRVLGPLDSMPPIGELDSSGRGEVWSVRKRALYSGMAVNDASYVGLENAYKALANYLNSLSIKPWDTTTSSTLTIDAKSWSNLWADYYNAVFVLNEATTGLLNGRITRNEQDIGDEENGLLTRVSEAESKVLDSSIVNTVTSSEEFKLNLDTKANSEDLSNYSTASELELALQAVYKELGEQIEAIDLTPFVTTSQLEQTSESFNFKFSSSGGINLLKNSTGFAGTDFWEVTGTVNTLQNDELQTRGAGSGFVFDDGTLKQTILVKSVIHTISVIVKKGEAGFGHLKVSDGSYVYEATFEEGTSYDYDKYSVNIFPNGTQIDVELYGSAGSELILTSTMANIGSEPLQWQHSNGEIYNSNVLMDLNGIRVLSSVYEGYTAITPEEFSGYALVDGVMTRVFTLNRDVTEMTKADVDEEITMNPIKVIPIKTAQYNGWAFVPSDN